MPRTGQRRRKGEGSITDRGERGYEGYITVEDGKRRYFSGKTEKDVLDQMHDALYQYRRGLVTAPAKQRFDRYLDDWLLYTAKPRIAPSTLDSYQRTVDLAKKTLGRHKLETLRADHFRRWMTEMQDAGKAPSTINTMANVLRIALNQAVKDGMILRSPMLTVKPLKVPDVERNYLTLDQLTTLLNHTKGTRWHALWMLLGTVGPRIGEALALRWSDLELEGPSPEMHIRQGKRRYKGQPHEFGELKNKSARRTILLPPIVADALKAHRVLQREERLKAGPLWQESDLVFTTQFGKPEHSAHCWVMLNKALKELGLPQVSNHEMRHTAATLQTQMGTSVRVLQAMLGHATPLHTMKTYTHITGTMQEGAAAGMDALIRSSLSIKERDSDTAENKRREPDQADKSGDTAPNVG